MPVATVILTSRGGSASDLTQSALSVSRQLVTDWQLRIVDDGDPQVAAAAAALASGDGRTCGRPDLQSALADCDADVVCFLQSGARYPADYLTAVLAEMSDPAVRCTVAARSIEYGPRFAQSRRVPPDAEPVRSQVSVRRADALLPLADQVAGAGRRDLPEVVVATRFEGAGTAAPPQPTTAVIELSEASPPLAVKPQLAELAAAALPIVVAASGPARAARALLGRWLQDPGIAIVTGPTPAAARRTALGLVATDIVTFLPAGWEVDPSVLPRLAGLLEDRKAAAVVPVALDAGGSVLAAGMVWADRGSLPQRMLAGHPAADVAGRVLMVPSPHPEGLTMRTAAARAAADGADAPAPWWGVQLLRGDGPVLVDGGSSAAIPRFAPPAAAKGGRLAGRLQPATLRSILGSAPDGAVAGSREALAELGWSVVGVQQHGRDRWRALVARAPTTTEPIATRRWALKIGAPPGRRGDPWGDVFFADDLAAALRALGNDVVVDRDGSAGRAGAYLDRVVLNLRGYQVLARQPGAVNLLWIISHPDKVTGREMRGYDRVYAASATWPGKALREHGVQVEPLLQATNPERFHPDAATPDTGPDLLFVGNSRHQFRPIVADCRAAGLRPTVIGRDWERFLPQDEIAALSVPNSELPAAYRAAGIVLNDHWGDMAQQGFLNNRLFDAVACGARVVSDPVPGLESVFGDAVAVYRRPADLAALCAPAARDRFGTDEQRRRRAAVVAQQHSFLARARQLMAEAARVEILPAP